MDWRGTDGEDEKWSGSRLAEVKDFIDSGSWYFELEKLHMTRKENQDIRRSLLHARLEKYLPLFVLIGYIGFNSSFGKPKDSYSLL